MGRVAPQRSIKGKEKARPFARPNQPPSDEVIVIESSEDDFPAKSVSSIIPPNPARKSSGPASLSAAVLNPVCHIMSTIRTVSDSHVDKQTQRRLKEANNYGYHNCDQHGLRETGCSKIEGFGIIE
jgi:hypothetical protein